MHEQGVDEMKIENFNFNIALPNLIGILGDALYSTWEVAVRELIQNSHDAIIRMDPQPEHPRITIDCNMFLRTLVIEDNGEGMMKEQMIHQLSTIGAGASIEYRKRLKQGRNDTELNKVIGQFGIGLLASFLLGDKIEIESRSMQAAVNEAVRWTSRGGSGYSVEYIEKKDIGTKVIIHLGIGESVESAAGLPIQHRRILALNELNKPDALEKVVKQYCELISVPIFCRNIQLNCTVLPWQNKSNRQSACGQFLEQRFAEEIEIAIPINEDECRGILGGALFIPHKSILPDPLGNRVDLFLKRMYIGNKYIDILPSWASFFSGVINAWHLTPTLARDDVRKDHTFWQARKMIENALKKTFIKLSSMEPGIFKNLVRTHSGILKKYLPEMPTELAKLITPELLFDSISGAHSFRETIKLQAPLDKKTIMYFDGPPGDIRRELIEGLVDISYIIITKDSEDERALQMCAKHDMAIQLQKYILPTQMILPRVIEPRWQKLEDEAFKYLQVPVQVCAFRNPAIPGLMLMRRMNETQKSTFNDFIGDNTPSEDIETRLSEMNSVTPASECLFLNSNCDLIQLIAKYLHDGIPCMAVSEAIKINVYLIWDIVRLISGKDIIPAQVFRMFSNFRSLAALLFQTSTQEGIVFEHVNNENNFSCLIISPFDEYTDGLKAIVEKELNNINKEMNISETWDVHRADNVRLQPELFSNILSLMKQSRLCVADFRGLNANVFIETGLALCMKKTLIPIIPKNEIESIPSDLRFLSIETYDRMSPGDDIYNALKKELSK